jgi:uncharacterized protein YciI
MGHYLLEYELVEDYLDRRPAFREQHLARARAAHDRGELVLAGALADPVDRAVLVFRGSDRAEAEAFARDDPYVRNGLARRWTVRDWTVVVGGGEEPSPATGSRQERSGRSSRAAPG